MSTIKTATVVVGVDGSASAERALLWAADEAVRRDAPLLVVHVGDTPRDGLLRRETAQIVAREVSAFGTTLLQDAIDTVTEAFPGLTVSTALREGRPADGLVDLSFGASIVVVGRGDHSAFGRLLLGSNARRVADRAHSPVVVVSESLPDPSGPIVIGVSLSENGVRAMDEGCAEAAVRGVDVLAIRSWPDFAWTTSGLGFPLAMPLEGVQEAQQRVLDTAVAAAHTRYPGVHITPRLCTEPTDVALRSVDNASLVVVGRRYSTSHAPRLGPITSWLIEHAPCPVLIVGGDVASERGHAAAVRESSSVAVGG